MRGGGRGTRLYPLTKYRSKPAVPLAGKYRLIDVPISNCINSQVNRIYVLTQFNSVSLHRHIRRAYSFDIFSGGGQSRNSRYAQQTLDNAGWYQGTADAVRQNIRYLQQSDIHHVLILSGDQLYRMNYADMLATHAKSGADVTIAAMPVTREAASGFGIMRSDDAGRVVEFLEKPKTTAEMDSMRTDPAWIDARGVVSGGRDQLASLGIYLFNRDLLVDVPHVTDYHDFGRADFSGFDQVAPGANAPIRRLLGRHRHDQVVLPVQPRPAPATHSSTWFRPSCRSIRRATCRRRTSTEPRSATASSPTAA